MTFQVHVTGVIVHGRKYPVYAYTWFDNFPNDSNIVIAILNDVLIKNLEDEKQLPETLYLQLDNCGRENKNKYVFTYCHFLVAFGVFKKVKVSFLPVGHTHNDVDQFFQRINKRLSGKDCLTLWELQNAIFESYKSNKGRCIEIQTVHLDQVGLYHR